MGNTQPSLGPLSYTSQSIPSTGQDSVRGPFYLPPGGLTYTKQGPALPFPRSLECHPCLWTPLSLSSPDASPLSSNPEAGREAAGHDEMSGRPGSSSLCHHSPYCESLGKLPTFSEPQFPHSSHVRFHPRPMTLTLPLARGAGNIPDLPLLVDCCVLEQISPPHGASVSPSVNQGVSKAPHLLPHPLWLFFDSLTLSCSVQRTNNPVASCRPAEERPLWEQLGGAEKPGTSTVCV